MWNSLNGAALLVLNFAILAIVNKSLATLLPLLY